MKSLDDSIAKMELAHRRLERASETLENMIVIQSGVDWPGDFNKD